MSDNQKLISAMGLCRRAGKLVMGFDAVKKSVLDGKAVMVITACDLAENTKKKLGYFCEDLIEVTEIPVTIDELLCVTPKPVGVFAVIDTQLAKLCKKAAGEIEL